MDLEPQAVRGGGARVLEVLGLEAQPRGEARGHRLLQRGRRDRQLLIGVSDPMPFGVLIVVQVPLATYFQALPW